jgi:hypothetical protein
MSCLIPQEVDSVTEFSRRIAKSIHSKGLLSVLSLFCASHPRFAKPCNVIIISNTFSPLLFWVGLSFHQIHWKILLL